MQTNENKPMNAADQVVKPNSKRKTVLTVLSLALLLGLGSYLAYQTLVASRYEKTDNAYVNADIVQITPLLGGTVRAIHADDTDFSLTEFHHFLPANSPRPRASSISSRTWSWIVSSRGTATGVRLLSATMRT